MRGTKTGVLTIATLRYKTADTTLMHPASALYHYAPALHQQEFKRSEHNPDFYFYNLMKKTRNNKNQCYFIINKQGRLN